ncbi:MAG: OmpH family outer membrane protein [Alcanivoracaceae bacterium]|nr:OmpH family outer membrane protein [Alcanivoracaceae bacterium]
MKSKIYKPIGKGVILILLLFYTSHIYSAEKIGFVDMETLINNSPQINHARATISSEFEVPYTDIEQKESDLELLENRITKDGTIMSLSELGKLQERARILDRQVRRAKEDLKDAISIRNNQILNNIQEELKIVVEQYAIENNYDAILINAILYVSDEMDITQEILQVLKEKNNKNEN